MSFWQSPSTPLETAVAELLPIEATPAEHAPEATPNGFGRQCVESLICLAIAVLMFRCFGLEGYIISTGSMAPNLLGAHKRVECPDCGRQFPFGVAFDREVTTSPLVRCPNCQQPAIDVTEVPRNDGDQLLVFKQSYEFRDPRRWEIVVFLNPANPLQAYVKRVIGLPGETIQVRDGDVFINGSLARKSLEKQRTLRIPVFDHEFVAQSDDWLPRWVPDSGWAQTERSFIRSVDEDPRFAWVQYRHWPRRSPEGAPTAPRNLAPHKISDAYGYNRIFGMDEEHPVRDLTLTAKIDIPETGKLASVLETGSRLAVCVIDAEQRQAQLYVLDDDQDLERIAAGQVAPVAISTLSKSQVGKGIDFEFSNFDQTLSVALNGQLVLHQELDVEAAAPVRIPTGRSSISRSVAKNVLPPEEANIDDPSSFGVPPAGTPARAEITIAGYTSRAPAAPDDNLNSEDIAPTRETSSEPALPSIAQRSQVRFGATSGAFRVRELKIFRDIHYLSEPGQHACDAPLALGNDDFFFLGDNSPVSLDSRGWKSPTVPRRLLVGRPLCVHLPSRPARIRFGESSTLLRLPDFEHMRWIR